MAEVATMNRASRDWVEFDEHQRRTRQYDPDSPTPFRDAAGAYRTAGWPTVFHLPSGDKKPPPEGFTGRDANVPDDELIEHWRETEATGNIGGQVPRGYIGIDVDNYGDYHGAADLKALEDRLGPLPPTDKTSSRGPDDPSGIRIYRIPEGIEFPGRPEGHPGIQFIQHHHRYVVLPPSIHPEGRRYVRYGPSGKPFSQAKPLSNVPELPRVWVREFGTKAKARGNGKAELSVEELRDMLADMPDDGGELCQAMSDRLRRGLSDCESVPKGGRHDDIVGGKGNHVFALARMGEQGHIGARTALSDLRDAFVKAVEADRTGGTEEAHAEFDRALAGALKQITADPTPEAKMGCCGSGDPDWYRRRGGELWEQSDQLRQLAAFARERFLSPAAVLGSVLAVTAVHIGPHVVLPGPPKKASLNVFVGLVARSGGFKTSAVGAVLDEYEGWTTSGEIPTHEVGTGQGITAVYVRPVSTGEPVQFCETALFTLDEIGSLAAHAAQGGANVLPILKTAYSGGRLGAAYADKDRRRPVGRHRYRLALVAGIQPRHAGVILDDIDGGFPQRWLWLPAIEPDAPEESGEYKPGWKLLGQVPRELAAREDDHEQGVRRQREIVLPVCDEAATVIRAGLDRSRRGRTGELEAHANLTRLKVAALLDAWHGRVGVDAWGWETSGMLMEISDRTRQGVIEHLAETEDAKEQTTSKRLAARAVESDQARERHQIVATAGWIARKVWAEPERWTAKALRESGSPVRREWFEEGLDDAVAQRWVAEVTEASHTDKPKRGLRPGKVRRS